MFGTFAEGRDMEHVRYSVTDHMWGLWGPQLSGGYNGVGAHSLAHRSAPNRLLHLWPLNSRSNVKDGQSGCVEICWHACA